MDHSLHKVAPCSPKKRKPGAKPLKWLNHRGGWLKSGSLPRYTRMPLSRVDFSARGRNFPPVTKQARQIGHKLLPYNSHPEREPEVYLNGNNPTRNPRGGVAVLPRRRRCGRRWRKLGIDPALVDPVAHLGQHRGRIDRCRRRPGLRPARRFWRRGIRVQPRPSAVVGDAVSVRAQELLARARAN